MGSALPGHTIFVSFVASRLPSARIGLPLSAAIWEPRAIVSAVGAIKVTGPQFRKAPSSPMALRRRCGRDILNATALTCGSRSVSNTKRRLESSSLE